MFGIFIATLILGTLVTSVYLGMSFVAANRSNALQLSDTGGHEWPVYSEDYAVCLDLMREQRVWSKRVLFDLKRIFA